MNDEGAIQIAVDFREYRNGYDIIDLGLFGCGVCLPEIRVSLSLAVAAGKSF
jgi:hypothetical protein